MKVTAQNVALQYDEIASAVDRGEALEIAYEGRPALHLVPALKSKPKRPISEVVGIFQGQITIHPSFFSKELNDEIADEFENGRVFPSERE